MRGKMRVYAASGHNITTAADMKKALDSGTGVVGMNVRIILLISCFCKYKGASVEEWSK